MSNAQTQLDQNPMLAAGAAGIVGHGAYVPRYRLAAQEISKVWAHKDRDLPLREKAVPGWDEDTATMCIEAARNAIRRANIDPSQIQAVWIGSESHPYAVKPTGTIVAEAVGASPLTLAADFEFACKAGTEALQAGLGFIRSGMGSYALVAGMDTAQSRPGDALEYTAAAGGAAFILGPAEKAPVQINHSLSWVSDTPDFWRRPTEEFPSHAGRFTGEPGYFQHVLAAGRRLLDVAGTRPEDYAHIVVHQPNPKYAVRVMQKLGFEGEQWQLGLLAPAIGNTYAGSALLGLSAVLDQASSGARILLISYGSGGGSDAFDLEVRKDLTAWQSKRPSTLDYVKRRTSIDYSTYARLRGKFTS